MNCTGQLPLPRYGHSAHIVGSRMFIIGGKGPSGAIYNDVYFLDLVEWIWVPVATLSQGPSARLNQASTLVGRKIVIHGGWNGRTFFNDLWIFNTDSFGWMQPKTTGFAPSARYGHSLTLTPDGRLLVFGGCSANPKDPIVPIYNQDIRHLDTETMIWTRPKVTGLPPTARFQHSATLLDNNTKLVVFGGWGKGGCQNCDIINNPRAFSVHVLDTVEMKWLLPQWVGRKPIKHLFAHCSSGTFDSNSILLFGGSDGRQSVNEFEQDEGEYDDFAEGGEYMENQDGEQENQGQLGQGDQGEFQGQGQENY